VKDTADTNPSLRRIASAHPEQWLYLLGDEGVVYSETQNRFAGLDAAAVSAYQAFDAGAAIEDLRTSGNAARSSQLEDLLDTIYALSQGIFPDEAARVQWPILQHPVIANVEIHGIPVFLEYPADPPAYLCRDPFLNCPATRQPARYHVSAQLKENGWAIYGNGSELVSTLREEQLGLGFLHAARSLLYAGADYDVAFHAAMAADDDRGVMLCAPREAGKSTLAAYLAAQGFALLADEPSLLHLDTCAVDRLCLPVSLKEGSWAVLRREWPQLAGAPVHMRSDGAKIRLLHPPPANLPTAPRRLTHILFPEYRSSCAAHAERVSPLRTLSLLNEGGMILAEDLTRDKFEAFLRLACATPSYIFRYDSLPEAGRMIRELPIEPGLLCAMEHPAAG
jgi:hypothetical protein